MAISLREFSGEALDLLALRQRMHRIVGEIWQREQTRSNSQDSFLTLLTIPGGRKYRVRGYTKVNIAKYTKSMETVRFQCLQKTESLNNARGFDDYLFIVLSSLSDPPVSCRRSASI